MLVVRRIYSIILKAHRYGAALSYMLHIILLWASVPVPLDSAFEASAEGIQLFD
jgi:hypothetical protein